MSVMGSKRPNTDTYPKAFLLNASTGEKSQISGNDEFVIGRSLLSSLVLEEIYISRRHCIIKYENNEFKIYDNNTSSGTFLNCNQLLKGIDHSVSLQHGDLITFGDLKKMDYVYKFCSVQSQEKKPKLDVNVKEEKDDTSDTPIKYEDFKNSLAAIHSEILNFKVEKLILASSTKKQISEFQEMINLVTEHVSKISNVAIKQVDVIQDLNKKLDEFRSTVMIQQECLDDKKIHQDSSLELIKTQTNGLLENDLQCPICNEVMIKPHLASCTHSFCESCISRWLSKSSVCPVCRAPVQRTTFCLALDNFITNLYELIGGTSKEEHDNLQNERKNPSTKQTARRGRRRTNIDNSRLIPQMVHLVRRPLLVPNNLNRQLYMDPVDIVDLTNLSSPSTPRR